MTIIIERKSIFYMCFFLTNPYLFLTNPDLTSYKPLLISYKPRFDFLQTPTYFLQTPIYKIILLDLFKMYISVHQPIGFSLLCFIFIYSHLLLSFLLISLDNVRSCVFLFSLFIV